MQSPWQEVFCPATPTCGVRGIQEIDLHDFGQVEGHPLREAFSKRPRREVKAVVKKAATRRNVRFEKYFDSTFGYPGERPAPRGVRRKPKRKSRSLPAARRERFLAHRTQSERRQARMHVSLRVAILFPRTMRGYRTAFRKCWAWAGRDLPAV